MEDMNGLSSNRREGASEERLSEIRQAAATASGLPAASGAGGKAATALTGYYGLPLLKPPQWKWEVPGYFFAGGAAGAAAVIAGAAQVCGANPRLVRDARWIAAVGGAVSPALLIADLGRPERFLNMLRVLKLQSPMSVGSWTLAVFSSAAAAALFFDASLRGRSIPAVMIGAGSQAIATLTGMPLATYTGVLLGATAVPVWSKNAAELPVHFAASAVGSAVSLLELKNHESDRALNALGIGSAVVETLMSLRLVTKPEPALKALKTGKAGWLSRAGAVLSGPLPLILRLLAGSSGARRSRQLRRVAAASTVAGSALTRYAWVSSGRASTADPALPLQLPSAETGGG
ncbi:MAG: NrfD/PsrC family molybdoenzyme membrane anchor subunit [Terriglobia bacterium]